MRPRTALGVLVVTVAVALTAAASAPAAPVRVGFVQFNACGFTCRHGAAVVSDAERAVRTAARAPFVVTVEELCRSDFTTLVAGLGDYHGPFQTSIPGRCVDGTDLGDAVLVRTAAYTQLGSWLLPSPQASQPRRMTCVRATPPGAARSMTACVAHTDWHVQNSAVQVRAVAQRVSTFLGAGPVLVGGDFNTPPSAAALDPMYDASYPRGSGSLVEADAANRSRTTGSATSTYNQLTDCGAAPCPGGAEPPHSKVDDVFLSAGDFADVWAVALSARYSDHRPVIGGATLR